MLNRQKKAGLEPDLFDHKAFEAPCGIPPCNTRCVTGTGGKCQRYLQAPSTHQHFLQVRTIA
ncbi:DUF6422 family protein [Acetobacter aceti]|uniref:DUF6422 family protein n=1 Tax=Acetobacter aceti TaxID=435 RepID=UPI0038D1C63C